MSEVFQQTLATDKCEVEAGCGKEDVSGKNVENDGERDTSSWDVGVKDQRQRSFDNWPTRKGRRNTRSAAAGIASQRILGASEMLP